MSDDTVLRIEIRQDGAPRHGGGGPESHTDGASSPDEARRSASPSQLMRLISGRNVELLRLIKARKPKSVSELARMSGRPKASLTRTLQRLSALGIVVLKRANGRSKTPVVACDRLRLELQLTPEE